MHTFERKFLLKIFRGNLFNKEIRGVKIMGNTQGNWEDCHGPGYIVLFGTTTVQIIKSNKSIASPLAFPFFFLQIITLFPSTISKIVETLVFTNSLKFFRKVPPFLHKGWLNCRTAAVVVASRSRLSPQRGPIIETHTHRKCRAI